MRIVFALLLFGLLSVPAVDARQSQADEIEVRIFNTAKYKSHFRIEFFELVEDSRCPADVACIWAGDAVIKVKVTKRGESKVLELHANGDEAADAEFAGYKFRLVKLSPEPRSDVQIPRDGYRAAIRITKAE